MKKVLILTSFFASMLATAQLPLHAGINENTINILLGGAIYKPCVYSLSAFTYCKSR